VGSSWCSEHFSGGASPPAQYCQDTHAAHARSLVGVGATLSAVPAAQTVRAVHSRSVVAVTAADSYSESVHWVIAVQAVAGSASWS
jgi:hypothetical protein